MNTLKSLFGIYTGCLLLTIATVHAQNTQNEVLEMITRANKYWQTNNSTNVRSFWDNAAYHTGNMEVYAITGHQDYLDYSTAWAEYNNWMGATGTDKSRWTYSYDESANGVMFGDWQICFQTYIDLYKIAPDPKKIARAGEVFNYQMSTENDNYWWWADGLYMVMPVMVKMYQLSDNPLYLEKLYTWFKYAKELMYDGHGGIPCDSAGYTTTANLKSGAAYADSSAYANLFYRDANYVYPKSQINEIKNFWSRGNGWVFAGLAKVLKDHPAGYPHYAEFYQTYTEMAAAIIACQKLDEQGNGFWTQSMLANYPLSWDNMQGYETSGTAFFTYGLFWGLNNGVLDSVTYYKPALRAWNYLSKIALQESGKIGYVQPIGAQATQATPRSTTQNFGVGAFLLAAGEYYRYLQKQSTETTPQLFSLTDTLTFSTTETKKIFLLKGYNLTHNVTLTAPDGITLSKTTLTPSAFGKDGVLITATYNASTEIEADSIRFFSVGTSASGILVHATSKVEFDFPEGLFLNFDQSINPRAIVLSKYNMLDGVKLKAPQGISLSKDTLTQQEILNGDTVWATWDEKTQITEGEIVLINSHGTGKIEIFAAYNYISTWDGDNAKGDGSKLTDFGWTVTAADGITPAEATFNNYGVSSACRYLPPWEEYSYNGQQWQGERIAFIRWKQRSDVFNLPVYLSQGSYGFKGLATWNTNGYAPVEYTIALNAGKANTGTSYGSATNIFNEGFKLADYEFDFEIEKPDTFYLTIATNQGRDVICGVALLHVYNKNGVFMQLHPISTSGVNIDVTDRTISVAGLMGDAQVFVYNISGQKISGTHIKSETYTCTVEHSGYYVVLVKQKAETFCKKLIIY